MQKIIDQAVHFALACIVTWAFGIEALWAGAIMGLILGGIREVSEAGGSRIYLGEVVDHFKSRDPWIDLAFWALGGAAGARV